ncbi:MAG: bifunctional diguanylate cyclase/phosphodiesterase [Pseudomonadales bacterium]|nr:bifunctional diguanylate cyclase/phosphodiesterase [Pseudomonadales bacterium]
MPTDNPLKPNRALFFDRLNDLIDHRESKQLGIGLLLVDIQNFRNLNGTFGYEKGDQVLRDVFERLTDSFSKNGSVFYLSNDQFAVILPNLINPNLINLAARKAISTLESNYKIGESNLYITLNVGADYLADQCTAEGLLCNSERSLSIAKNSRKHYIERDFIKNPYHETVIDFSDELNKALDQNSIELYYQPKIDLVSETPTHAEALARWTSPTAGPVPPSVFIPIIEKIGRTDDLAKCVINTAIRQLNEWPNLWGDISVAVNISPTLVETPELLTYVNSALNIWDVEPSRLTLEVTEESIINNIEKCFENLSNIKSQGVKISIDDFGTGYSSMSYFKNIPADELKVDQSFVRHMLDNEADQNITAAVTDLAHKFGLSVVAEGVETKALLQALISIGCDYAQGYHFAKPLPQNQFIKWLNNYSSSDYF